MLKLGYNYKDYEFIVSESNSAGSPTIKIEEGANADTTFDILQYFSLSNPHSFQYKEGGMKDGVEGDVTHKSAWIKDYLGLGTVDGKKVYGLGSNLASQLSSPRGTISNVSGSGTIYLYQIDSINIKKVGQINISKDNLENVFWYDGKLVENYPLKMEMDKEYYYAPIPSDPNKYEETKAAKGFYNLTIGDKYFENCLAIRKNGFSNNSVSFSTLYYAQDYGDIYGEYKSMFIDNKKKTVTFYPEKTTYFIEEGKGDWSNNQITSELFVVDQQQKKSNIYVSDGYSFIVPDSWNDRYIVRDEVYGDSMTGKRFYSKAINEVNSEGWLFSIVKTKIDGEWEQFPDYKFLGFEDGEYYIMLFPTDMQYDVSDSSLINEYRNMENDIESIISTLVVYGSDGSLN